MAGRIRILDAANRTMQRLGYVKALCVIVNETETSSLAALGKRLIERVTKRVKMVPPFDEAIREYAKTRLTDGTYRELCKGILEGTEPVAVELQDRYLADPRVPSSTGKLVEGDWRHNPYLSTSLDLIKKGTYSALTRSVVLRAVMAKEEQAAFLDWDATRNPFVLSDAQAMVLLYCLVDNDAEVILPLFRGIVASGAASFNERAAGDMLLDVFRQIVRDQSERSLTTQERERLSNWRSRPPASKSGKASRTPAAGRRGGNPGSAGALLRPWFPDETRSGPVRLQDNECVEDTPGSLAERREDTGVPSGTILRGVCRVPRAFSASG